MKILYIPLLILLVGCGTSRTYEYPYNKMAKILKDKFVNRHDAFITTVPEVDESEDEMKISFVSDVDFYFGIGSDISLKKKNAKESTVTIKVIEYYKSWSYQSRNKEMEKEFLDIVGKRIKTGKWEKLPWQKKEELNTDIIPAILKNIGK